MSKLEFNFCFQKGNVAAHKLTKHALFVTSELAQLEKYPECILTIVLHAQQSLKVYDFMNEALNKQKEIEISLKYYLTNFLHVIGDMFLVDSLHKIFIDLFLYSNEPIVA